MQTLFSTANIQGRDAFKEWRESLFDRFSPIEISRIGDEPFSGSIEATKIGSLSITKTSHASAKYVQTQDTIRKSNQGDFHTVGLGLQGSVLVRQFDRDCEYSSGGLVLLDKSPFVMNKINYSSVYVVMIPRKKIENILGPAKLYSALAVESNSASANLVTKFFKELIHVNDALSADIAERMASIGQDLIIASLADRMAMELPRQIHGNVIVQRAKTYIEENLSDQTLDPKLLAAAMGVSLRRLQELFHERGQHISEWIWKRRLETAAQRLGDPACIHLSIQNLAYGCGFATQAHFTRRFRDCYGISPGEYRRQQINLKIKP